MYLFLLLYTCFTYIYIYVYIFFYICCCNPALLKYMHIYTPALLILHICIFILLLCCYFTRQRHLALVFKGLLGLKHFIAELRHIITPTKLLARPVVLSVTTYIRMLCSCMHTLKYLYICMYALLVFYSCFTPLDICNCCNPPFTYIYSFILLLFSYFTRTFLAVCVCVPAYWPTRVCGAK